MASSKAFKILILGLILLLSQSLFAREQCSNLFVVAKPKLEKISKENLSRIHDIEWLKKKLFKEGWHERIKAADYEREHIELYSEMLYETTQLLLKEFYKENSELALVPGAGDYLQGIIRDIKNHRTNHAVTKKYFLSINSVIANYISMKHERDASGKYLKQSLEVEKTDKQIDSMIKSEREDIFALTIPPNLKQDVVLVPTFAEFSIETFIDMGIIEGQFFPIGMTLETKVRFDGIRNASAKEFFIHDLVHAREIVRARLSETALDKKFNKTMQKAGERYRDYRMTLDPETRELMDIVIFGFVHEQEISSFYEFLKPNGRPSWEKMDSPISQRSLLSNMMYFVRRDFDREPNDKVLQDSVRDEFHKFVLYYRAMEKLEQPNGRLKTWIQSKFLAQ